MATQDNFIVELSQKLSLFWTLVFQFHLFVFYFLQKQRMQQLAREHPENPYFIFGISLKEIVTALHKHYLNVSGILTGWV